MEVCKRALAIFRELNTPTTIAAALSNLGYARSCIGEHDGAVEALQEALKLFKGIDEPISLAQILVRMALAEADAGKLDGALTTARKALGVYKKLDQAYKVAYCRSVLARLNGLAGKTEEAARLVAQAEPIVAGMPDSVEKLKCRLNLGAALRMTGDRRRAYDLLRVAYLGFFGINAAPGVAQTLGELGRLALETGNYPVAAAYLAAAVKTLGTFGGHPPAKEPLEAALDEVRTALNRDGQKPAAFDPANPPEL
jgi:tetratricopeptide (TPR) repeat protein